MKIAFNPSNSSKNILDLIKTNKDIIFDLKGHSIYARGVEFKGTDTNTWRDIKINNVSIGSHTLDLRNGNNTTLTNTNGIVTINSTWRPVVDNLTSNSTTSSLSANQGRVLKALIDGNAGSATKLQTARRIWGQSFDGTADVDNTLRIRKTTGSYCEGIRIQTGDGNWATIILGATADSGTNTNAWSIHRKSDNNFAISRNSSDGTNGLVMTSVGMGLGTTTPTQRLDVRGDTKITGSIRDLAIGGGIFWNPNVESATDGSDAASITLVKSGVAGGTTLVLSQMNDANDTIQFKTNGSARLYHNSYPILTTQNTYVNNHKGYINGTEITQVNNADLLDGLDWNNFFSRRFYTFNLSSYSLSNFYPLFFVDTDIELDCEIHSENKGAGDPYNQNRLHFQITARGRSDTGLSFHLLSQNNYDNSEITIGSVGIGTQQGGICIWVRGGRTYRVYSNREPLFKSSNYTYGDEIYSVGTNIWGGTNTKVNLVWKNDSTRKDALIATRADKVASATKVIVNQHTTNDNNYPLVWSNQANTSNVTENQLHKSWADLYYNPKNKRLTVGGSVVTSSFIKSGGTSQQLLRADGGIASFNWAGQSGQPAWLWGGNSEHSYYVYNPSNFRVAYASSAGNADTLDGEHASSFVRAGVIEVGSLDLNALDTYSFIKSVNSQVAGHSPKGNIGWYNVIQLVHRNGAGDGPSYIGQIALGMTTNVNDIFFRTRRTDPWKTIIHSNNYTEFIDNYYWANVKISTSANTQTTPSVNTIFANNWFRSQGDTGWYNESYGGGIRMTDTKWIRTFGGKSFYCDSQISSQGFHHLNHDNNDAVLLAGGSYMIHKTGSTSYSTAIQFGNYVWLTLSTDKATSNCQVVPYNISNPTKNVYVTSIQIGNYNNSRNGVYRVAPNGKLYYVQGTEEGAIHATICYIAS